MPPGRGIRLFDAHAESSEAPNYPSMISGMDRDRRLVYSTDQGRLDKRYKPAKTQVQPAGKDGVRIRRESKGRGGKTVCVIYGLPLADARLKALLKEMKGALGAGGTVKNGVIEIQGDHRDKLLVMLAAKGIKAKAAGG